MTRRAGPRRARGDVGVLWTLLVWVLIVLPRPISAQQEGLLFQRQAEYNAARDQYNASVSAWSAQEVRWVNAVDARVAAVNSGNEDRLEVASQVAYAESMEMTRLESRVAETARALEVARRAFREALELRQSALAAQADAATGARRLALLGQVRGISDEIEALEPAEALLGPTLRFMPALDLDPRDGRLEIESKISLVERRIQDTRAEITRVNEDLARLRKQQDMRRMAGDVRSNRDFFDNGPPGGARAGRPVDPTQAGATTAAASPRTIDQRIEELTAYRETLELQQEQLRVRVANFRNKLGVIGGDL
jgi:hypothetical protein